MLTVELQNFTLDWQRFWLNSAGHVRQLNYLGMWNTQKSNSLYLALGPAGFRPQSKPI